MIQPKQSRLGRMYETLALLAVANIVALIGVTGYFTMNGTLTVERLRAAVAALWGECKEIPLAAAKDQKENRAQSDTPSQAAVSVEELDMMQREAERLKTEIDQRMALANSIMLKVKTEREAFRQEKDAADKQQVADRAKFQNEGFQKQLQILTALAPKTALGHILAMNDPDKAAQFLAAMEPLRAKKIIESAKRGEDSLRMKAIVQKMQDVGGRNELRAQAGEEP